MALLKDLIVQGPSRFCSDIFANNIYSNKFIISGGLGTQFLKADGTLDSNTYATTSSLGTAASHAHGDYVTSLGTSGNTLTWAKGGTAQTAITVPYASSAGGVAWSNVSSRPTKLSDFTNDVVNNATLTIQKNGTSVATFTSNASGNATANITVPTTFDDLSDGTTNKAFTSTEKTKLSGIASGAEVNVQSDWSQTTTTADDYIKNKPTKLSQFTNDIVNNATLTIQKNGTSVATFTSNAASNVTANITVPTTLDDLADGSTRKLANYLPLAGGDMTGANPISFPGNVVQFNWRTGHDSYNSKLEYMTAGNEALVFANQNPVTSFLFMNGLNLTNRSDYAALGTAALQIKSNKVTVNKTVRGDSDTQAETFVVGGTARVEGNDMYIGSSTGSQCHIQYDNTNKCIKFFFD